MGEKDGDFGGGRLEGNGGWMIIKGGNLRVGEGMGEEEKGSLGEWVKVG